MIVSFPYLYHCFKSRIHQAGTIFARFNNPLNNNLTSMFSILRISMIMNGKAFRRMQRSRRVDDDFELWSLSLFLAFAIGVNWWARAVRIIRWHVYRHSCPDEKPRLVGTIIGGCGTTRGVGWGWMGIPMKPRAWWLFRGIATRLQRREWGQVFDHERVYV